jgi:hypothetical protein
MGLPQKLSLSLLATCIFIFYSCIIMLFYLSPQFLNACKLEYIFGPQALEQNLRERERGAEHFPLIFL